MKIKFKVEKPCIVLGKEMSAGNYIGHVSNKNGMLYCAKEKEKCLIKVPIFIYKKYFKETLKEKLNDEELLEFSKKYLDKDPCIGIDLNDGEMSELDKEILRQEYARYYKRWQLINWNIVPVGTKVFYQRIGEKVSFLGYLAEVRDNGRIYCFDATRKNKLEPDEIRLYSPVDVKKYLL